MNLREMIRRPSAFVPVVMSGLALLVLAAALAVNGLQPQPDEGAAAHLWQLLMAGQIPFIAYFALRWVPRQVRAGLAVLGLQVLLALIAMAPVYLLRL